VVHPKVKRRLLQRARETAEAAATTAGDGHPCAAHAVADVVLRTLQRHNLYNRPYLLSKRPRPDTFAHDLHVGHQRLEGLPNQLASARRRNELEHAASLGRLRRPRVVGRRDLSSAGYEIPTHQDQRDRTGHDGAR
jgi:hypothetical protein